MSSQTGKSHFGSFCVSMFFLVLLFLLQSQQGFSQQNEVNSRAASSCTMALTLKDSIGAATYDAFQRVSEAAQENKCSSILIRINTPGGHLSSTRLITEHILASPIPFLCLISPAGGHAGSAGAIILQACHVSGGLTATNVGAATPVLGTGQEIPADLRNKMVNDTVSWVQGMAQLRGRNQDFSRRIVTEGLAVTTEEAVKMKALDFAVASEADFLSQAEGRQVLNQEKTKSMVQVGSLQELPLDVRYQILQFVSEPEWAYLIFMGALLLLYAEFSNPGLILPGVTGAILLVLSLVAFHKLDANIAGLALMVLGLAFWVAELFITSKGILGIAGTAAFLIGSFLLFDEKQLGLSIPLGLILTAGLVFGGVSFAITYFAAQTLRTPKHDYDLQMKNASIRVVEVATDGKSGKVEVLGEFWNFNSDEVMAAGDSVVFVERNHLILKIKKRNGRV